MLQPVSETGYTVAIAVTVQQTDLFLLYCRNRLWWLVVINMVRDNKKKNRDAKYAPTDQFNDPCKDNRHSNKDNFDKINDMDEDLTSPGAQRKSSAETIHVFCSFFR